MVALTIYLADIADNIKNGCTVAGSIGSAMAWITFAVLYDRHMEDRRNPRPRVVIAVLQTVFSVAILAVGVLYPSKDAIYRMAGVTKQNSGEITVTGEIKP